MYFHPKNLKSGSTVVPPSYAPPIDHIPVIERMLVIKHMPAKIVQDIYYITLTLSCAIFCSYAILK